MRKEQDTKHDVHEHGFMKGDGEGLGGGGESEWLYYGRCIHAKQGPIVEMIHLHALSMGVSHRLLYNARPMHYYHLREDHGSVIEVGSMSYHFYLPRQQARIIVEVPIQIMCTLAYRKISPWTTSSSARRNRSIARPIIIFGW